MRIEQNQKYWDIIEVIGDSVYQAYNSGGRKDLIILYSVKERRLYSYVYEEFKNDLNERSQQMLEEQYKNATEEGKVVLFIRDEAARKFKSFTI
ncbi:MAG: hypothetical protein AB8B69_17365 [Chitinophagales bacterium]